MELFTTSRASCFRRCRREHKHKYEDLRRPIKSAPALSFGSIFHDGVEQWRLCIMEGREDSALDAAFGAIKAKWLALNTDDSGVDEFELVKAEEMILGYHCMWFESDVDDLEYVAVEKQFTTPLRNPDGKGVSRTFQLGGKIDAIAKTVTKFGETRFWTVETKTSSQDISAGSKYWRRLRLDGQISTYYNGAESLGFPPHGCIYDVAKKPSVKPYKATPEEDRRYTQPKDAHPGKPCRDCKDRVIASAKNFRDEAKKNGIPNDELPKVPKASEIEYNHGCDECTPPKDAEPSRLYSGQRDRDETPNEYRLRIRSSIEENPEGYFRRGEIVRLEKEMVEADKDAWQTADEMRRCKTTDTWPRNPGSCERYGRMCVFENVCNGDASIDDPELFRDSSRHPELDEEKV